MLDSFRRLLLPFLLLLPATPPRAQFIQLGGSGCPVSTAPSTSGSPRLGNVITITCPSCTVAQYAFMVIGTCAPAPFPAFYPPLACTIGPCYVAVNPFATLTPAYFSAMIPFNASLIGASFCQQCGCISNAQTCVRVWTALQVVIQP